MKKALRIGGISVVAAVLLFSLLYYFLNHGVASVIVESVLEMKTGCDVKVSGLHVNVAKPFPSIVVDADSLCMERVKDSIDIRIRDIDAKACYVGDSIFADCSLKDNFLKFGSHRVVLNDISLLSRSSRTGNALDGMNASLTMGESKFISTLFPLLTRVNEMVIEKNRDSLYVKHLSVRSGSTNVRISGTASNLSGYLSGKGDLEAVLKLQSDTVNVNEIMAGIYYGLADTTLYYAPGEEENESFIVAGKYVDCPIMVKKIVPFIIPDRLRVSVDMNVGKALVAILSMYDFSSHLDVSDRTVKASNCTFDSNFGKIAATLFYSSQSKDSLLAGADLQLRKLNAKQIVTLLPPVKDLDPLLSSFKGEFDCNAAMISQVDTAFIPIMKTLKGVLNFRGHGMSVSDAGDLRNYTSLLLFKNKNIGKIDDLNIYAIVSDGKVKLFPMTFGVDRYKLAMTGSHTFKNVFNYDVSVLKSPVPFKFGIDLRKAEKKDKVQFKFKNPTYQDGQLPSHYQEVSDAHQRLSLMIDNVLQVGASETQSRSSHITKELIKQQEDNISSGNGNDDSTLRSTLRRYYPSASRYADSKRSQADSKRSRDDSKRKKSKSR